MLTKDQAQLIFDLVEDIKIDASHVEVQSACGSMKGYDQAVKDLQTSVHNFKEYVESLIE